MIGLNDYNYINKYVIILNVELFLIFLLKIKYK